MSRVDIHQEGDLIKKLSIKKGYSQRPLWKTLESLKPSEMILWVDRADSLCPIAYEWALAQAFESSLQLQISKRNQIVRSIYAELNRLVYLTTYLSHVVKQLGISGIFEQGMILREQVFRIQEEFTGSRVLPQVFALGGVRRDLALGDIQKLQRFVTDWSRNWKNWCELVIDDPVLVERLTGLVKISARNVKENALWGIIGKASGVIYDSRLHQPYGAYAFIDFKLNFDFPLKGDAYSRFLVAVTETDISLQSMSGFLKFIDESKDKKNEILEKYTAGIFSGAAESGRGPVTSFVEIDQQGHVRGVKLFNTSQRIWPAIEEYFVGARAEDFELAWASLGVSAEEAEI